MKSEKVRTITRTVWILSAVSLCTDTASEMLYPVMPVYLESIGFSIILIGILEGIAEATAGLSKGYFGKLSDATGKRVPFVQFGYILSTISKPMLVAFTYPLWIFFSRTIDRLGKGIRTGARDALLSDEATLETKGRVFGFHRSMDTLGAAIGPALALLYLYFFPEDYTTLFLIAFIPGLFAVALSFLLKEAKSVQTEKTKVSFFASFGYWRKSPLIYKKLAVGLLVFTLFNSSDMFLLLKAKQSGLSDAGVIGVYIFYNLIYALFAYPLGVLADKIGLKTVFIIGIFVFSGVYFGMVYMNSFFGFMILFFFYGIYSAATEGISKALITNITLKKDTATAIGTYTGFQSICALIASSLAGLIWFFTNAETTFLITSIIAFASGCYFLIAIPSMKKL